MPHPRVRSIAHEWIWHRGSYEIELRVRADLQLDPGDPGFDRRLVDEVMMAVIKERGDGRGIIRRVILVQD